MTELLIEMLESQLSKLHVWQNRTPRLRSPIWLSGESDLQSVHTGQFFSQKFSGKHEVFLELIISVVPNPSFQTMTELLTGIFKLFQNIT